MSWRGWLALVWLAGCSTAGSGEPAQVAVDPLGNDPAPMDREPDASYSIHEWGLLETFIGGGLAELTAGPGLQATRPRPVKKPVLYVHLADGVASLSFSARVHMPNGQVIEHWPPAEMESDGGLFWKKLEARREHCGTAPTGACVTPDRICEINELPSYDVPSAACLHSGDTSAGLLFYRGATDALRSPFHVKLLADGGVSVSAVRDTSGAVGELWRISAAAGGYRIARAALPDKEHPVMLVRGTDAVDRTREEASLLDAMRELGLAEDEAKVFLGAWSDALLGGGAATVKDLPSKEATKAPAVAGAEPLADALLFWLPPANVDEIAALSFSPPPSAVHRAMLVRVDLHAR